MTVVVVMDLRRPFVPPLLLLLLLLLPPLPPPATDDDCPAAEADAAARAFASWRSLWSSV